MSKPMRVPERLSRTGLPPAGDWRVETSRSAVSISGRASRLAPEVRAEFGHMHPSNARYGDLRYTNA